ncbi:MAG: photosynthetic complex assembly protein PuhC [Shimia sp.]
MTDINHQTTLAAEQAKLRTRDKETIPLVLIRAMAALAIVSVALVAYARFTDRPLVGVPEALPIVAQADVLILPGEERGSFVVTDLDGTRLMGSGDHLRGFVGVVGQSLARRRMLEDIALTTPVQIVRRDNGRIDILDPASGYSLELMGYGRDNVAAFAALLP